MRFAPEYSELRKRSRDLIGSRRLASPEGARSLVGEGLRQIGEHGAVARLNEGLDRHAGDQAQTAEARELLLGERNPHRVIARAGALVSSEIAGNPRDLPIQLGRSALVEGGEAQHGVLPDPDLIDVLRVELRLHRQLIRLGDDHHDSLASDDHAADGMHGRLVDHAILGRPDVDTLELILGRDLALDELGDLALGLAQVLGDLRAQVLIDLQDLQLDLGDLALGLSDRGHELAQFPSEPYRVALERRHALDLDEVLAPQVAHAFKLLTDELDLALLRRGLAREALDLYP